MSVRVPIDTTLLHTFRTVVEKGSLSAAGYHLNCVQSNVTARIKKLEDHFGARLLERGRGGAKVTPFGALAFARISDILDALAIVENDLLDTADGRKGTLRLGAMETTAAARLPGLLSELRGKCPNTNISLKTAPTASLVELVWKHDLDAAFVAGPIDNDRFKSVHAFRENLVLLCQAQALKPDSGSLSMPEPNFPLLAFPEGCSYRSNALAWLKYFGRPDTSVTEMGSLESMIGCAAAGMGFLVVPSAAADRSPAASELVRHPLPEEYGSVETHLVWRYDRAPTFPLATLIDMLN